MGGFSFGGGRTPGFESIGTDLLAHLSLLVRPWKIKGVTKLGSPACVLNAGVKRGQLEVMS